MRTARFNANLYLLRKEFKSWQGAAIDVQPIDAPEVVPAGSTEWYSFINLDGGVPVSTGVVRS